jgi:hypothetical protein
MLLSKLLRSTTPPVCESDLSLAIDEERDRHGCDVVLLRHGWCGNDYGIRHSDVAAGLPVLVAREEWADGCPAVVIMDVPIGERPRSRYWR